MKGAVLSPGAHEGVVAAPVSKSHLHRLLIADFLAGGRDALGPAPGDSADIAATRRCLGALGRGESTLDCGESGSTRRFLAPIAAALGVRAVFKTSGRLAKRPQLDYPDGLKSGVHALAGDVSSQFVTALLFALPLLDGDSEIRFTSPLESRGYVDMTLAVLAQSGVRVIEGERGFAIPGGQRYRRVSLDAEGDWSGGAFWLAMNALGSRVAVTGLSERSAQPDRAIVTLLGDIARDSAPVVDVAACPDIFPVLSVVAAATPKRTRFTHTRRLRLKESDRIAAMADVLARFGVETAAGSDDFTVDGLGGNLVGGGEFTAFGDHRIAMSVAVGATVAASAVSLDDTDCAAKSYPGFFARFRETQKL